MRAGVGQVPMDAHPGLHRRRQCQQRQQVLRQTVPRDARQGTRDSHEPSRDEDQTFRARPTDLHSKKDRRLRAAATESIARSTIMEEMVHKIRRNKYTHVHY